MSVSTSVSPSSSASSISCAQSCAVPVMVPTRMVTFIDSHYIAGIQCSSSTIVHDRHFVTETLYLSRLGERVRAWRAEHGMTRKALAEASGVSERYLAQLEGGQGNISVLLLRR